MQFVQQLYEEDFQSCVEMCQMLLLLLTDPSNKNNIFRLAETAAFHLNGLVNKKHVRYWSEEISLTQWCNSPKAHVWCSMSENRVSASYLF